MTHPFNGLAIGDAAKATRALLDRLLDENATTFPEWVTLFYLAETDVPESELVTRLDARFKEGRGAEVVDSLTRAELITAGVSLTETGRARHQRISGGIDRIAERLYGDLPAADRETAGRLLALVTARAEAALAA
ncbi:hypothetical protein V5P93_003379 [Actinokineospora auranticolor]|uniref:DNA-binding MarR family transcriptional regulator n=1 Tax=Actinokineospora auranticolor TaxID=155976 RepID=A0A2S6GP93_9PSEU|nr:MarR family transcriptional regulator [Actinokineospora auranticolor]PPK67039.1 hypothetical protein CLV40_10836 [Actinokineospora auranticolor]